MGMLSIKKICAIVALCSSATIVPVQKSSLSTDLINFVKHTTQDFAVGIMFSYMHNSFTQYQKDHPIKYAVLSAYAPGKYIHGDINRLYAGETLLHKAIVRKDFDLVTTLLFLGANPLVKNAQGLSALALAEKLQVDSIKLNSLSSIKKLLEQYVNQQRIMHGRDDIELLHQAVVSKMVHFIAPFAADQGLSSVVESLQDYGQEHPFLSSIFMFGIRGHRFDTLINASWYQATFLQRCMQQNYFEFAKILLYLGADPLTRSTAGVSAFEDAVKTFNIPFVKLFWLYVSSPVVKEDMYPVLEKYQLLLLLCAMQDYVQTRSTVFLHDVATYFNVTQASKSALQYNANIIKLVEQINKVAWSVEHVHPFEIVSACEFKISDMVVRRNKVIMVPGTSRTISL